MQNHVLLVVALMVLLLVLRPDLGNSPLVGTMHLGEHYAPPKISSPSISPGKVTSSNPNLGEAAGDSGY